MTFDMTHPIVFSLTEAQLDQAAKWQALIEQLMTETDTFLITSVRDGEVIPEVSPGPAITLLLIAEQGELALPVGIGSIENGEVGMAILQQFQGAGLGQSLLSALLDWAAQVGLTEVWLDVQHDNRPAQHIYQKFGFQTTGQLTPLILPNGRETKLQRMRKTIT
ncbi:GNAT family N-acetyltransferase [Leuconostoc holzapfelii]|uniref:GNAT family N-acetyltransferase n=1 Tax=Leuconostoc holzapfelii TaxID=434464 RepID=A0ABT2NVT1_9LACO|nr:GNAT family N-acetyltransferase [Leuconostoc holzapfelii]MCT8389483.1 GNAT family N-acetyltransferase [Leuconostoc holzapfelii]